MAAKVKKENKIATITLGGAMLLGVGAVALGVGDTDDIAKLRQRKGNCTFALRAAWSPQVRHDLSLEFRVSGAPLNPQVTVSDWTVTRAAPCRATVWVHIKQTVFKGNTSSCSIRVNGILVSSRDSKASRKVECDY